LVLCLLHSCNHTCYFYSLEKYLKSLKKIIVAPNMKSVYKNEKMKIATPELVEYND
jgi:hypothetical protein